VHGDASVLADSTGEMMSNSTPLSAELEQRVTHLERALQRSRRITEATLMAAGVCVAAAWTGGATGSAPGMLHARGLIIEDSPGHPRILIGAPIPLSGRAGKDAGAGIAVLSPSGKLRVAVGAPSPSPQVNGKMLERAGGDAGGGAGGIIVFDTSGDERGGMGVLPNGAANVCLDYAKGPKEAVCLVVAPENAYAGLAVNGTPGQGYERASMVVSAHGEAQVKVAAVHGDERATLRADGTGPAALLVSDSAHPQPVNALPALGQQR
jgi:hypothetical protein